MEEPDTVGSSVLVGGGSASTTAFAGPCLGRPFFLTLTGSGMTAGGDVGMSEAVTTGDWSGGEVAATGTGGSATAGAAVTGAGAAAAGASASGPAGGGEAAGAGRDDGPK